MYKTNAKVLKGVSIAIGVLLAFMVILTVTDPLVMFFYGLLIGAVLLAIKYFGNWVLVVVVAALFFLGFIYFGNSYADKHLQESRASVEPEEEIVTYWSADVINDYEANEVKADQQIHSHLRGRKGYKERCFEPDIRYSSTKIDGKHSLWRAVLF